MIKVWIIALSILIVAGGMIAAHWLLRNAKDKKPFLRVTVYIYVPLALWSVIYFCVCLGYAGAWLSWIWIWPLITVFCMIRIFMIKRELEGSSRFKIPTAVRIIYRVLFSAGLAIFLFVESRVVSSMTAVPVKNDDYVIVMGAGLIGKEPTNPLRVRIEKAAEYMSENPDTILIASGGKGPHEEISEAECIRNRLVGLYGIDEDRIILEDRSTSTEENLINSMQIINDPGASVGIITNSFHEYRAMLIAEYAGYENAAPVPATTLLPVGIHYVVREFFGVVQFKLKN